MKLSFSAIWAVTLLSSVVPTGATFQSPPRGATYAASMVAGPDSTIYFTGIAFNPATQKSQCFIATANADPTEFLRYEVFGTTHETVTGDSCRSVAVLNGQAVALVGTADPEGYFGFVDGSEMVNGMPQLGFATTIDAYTLQPIMGTVLSSFARVPYPQVAVGDLYESNMMYVASMTSNQDTLTLEQEEVFPNWSHLFQHGTTFALTVEAFSLGESGVGKRWTKFFPVDADDTEGMLSSVHVGGMINKPGVGLVIAGATAGRGEAYGSVTGTEEDGFLAVLDPATGEMRNAHGDGSGRASQRFGSESYEIVTDICDDPFDDDAFYIVGSSKGDMNGHIVDDIVIPPTGSLQAFIRKINANTLEEEWTVQLPAYIDENTISSTDALGCAVNNIGSVYVVGQVDNGAGMVERNTIHVSKGGSDIWIARIDTVTAERMWIQQVGSAGDDFVARGGGIVIDADGNPIVFGDTNGNIYRERAVYAHHDLFVIRFDEVDGYFAPTLSGDVAGVTKEIFSYYEASETDPNGGEIESFGTPMEIQAIEAPMEETPLEEQTFEDEPPPQEQTLEENIIQEELQFAQELLPEGQAFEGEPLFEEQHEEENPDDNLEEDV